MGGGGAGTEDREVCGGIEYEWHRKHIKLPETVSKGIVEGPTHSG